MADDAKKGEFEFRIDRRAGALGEAWIALTGVSGASERPEVAWRRLAIVCEESRHLFVEKQRLKTDYEIAAHKAKNLRDEVREREVDYELFLSGLPPLNIQSSDKIFFWLAASKKRKRNAALEKAAEPVKAAREKLAALDAATRDLSAKIVALEIKAEKNGVEIPALESAYLKSMCAGFAAAATMEGWGSAYSYAAEWLLRDRRRPELILLMWLARLYAEESASPLPDGALGFSQLSEIMEDAGEKSAALAIHPDESRRQTGTDLSRDGGGEVIKPLFELLRVSRGALPEVKDLESPVRELAALARAVLEFEDGAILENPADLDDAFSNTKLILDSAKLAANKAMPGFEFAISRAIDAAISLCAYAFLRASRPAEFLRMSAESGFAVTKDHPDALAMTALLTLEAGNALSPELLRIMKSAGRTRLLWYTLALAGTGAGDAPQDGGGGVFAIPANSGGQT